ncbi:MAG: hypothetical protein ACYTHM_09675 [Planctomycetota bacterium]|jgi:hypothetical protein
MARGILIGVIVLAVLALVAGNALAGPRGKFGHFAKMHRGNVSGAMSSSTPSGSAGGAAMDYGTMVSIHVQVSGRPAIGLFGGGGSGPGFGGAVRGRKK